MTRILAVFTLAIIGASGFAARGQELASYPHFLPVSVQGGDGLQRLALPVSVHRNAARADLGDLRMFNASGERIPFALAAEPVAAPSLPRQVALTWFPVHRVAPKADLDTFGQQLNLQVQQRSDGTLISLISKPGTTRSKEIAGYIVDASMLKEPYVALELDWASAPDSQSGRVRLEGSDDLKSWSILAADTPLLDLDHVGSRLTQKRIELSPTRHRYLRLNWQGPAFVLKSVSAQLQTGTLPPSMLEHSAQGNPGEVAGDWLFDLGGRLPVERLELILPEVNTVAPVRIFARTDPASPWQEVSRTTFYRMQRDGKEIASPPFGLANPVNHRYWRLSVDTRSGGLGATSLRINVAWRPRSVVFAARGPGPYRLAYGNPSAQPSVLTLDALIPSYKSGTEYSLPLAMAGDAVTQTVVEPSAVEKLVERTSGRQVGLWAILLVGVGLLGWMAWRLNGQLQRPQDKGPV